MNQFPEDPKPGTPAETKDQPPAKESADVDAGPRPPQATRPRKGSGCGALILVAVLVAAAAGTGYATWPLWKGRAMAYVERYLPSLGAPSEEERQLADMRDRLQALEKSTAQVQARTQDVESNVTSIRELEAARAAGRAELAQAMERIHGLEGAINDLRGMIAVVNRPNAAEGAGEAVQQLAARVERLEDTDPTLQVREQATRLADENARLRTALGDLATRLDSLENSDTRAASAGDRARGILLAVGQLREAARGSGPFAMELDTLGRLVGGDQAVAGHLEALRPFAAEGVPTLAALQAGFAAIAYDIVQAGIPPTSDSWIDGSLDRLAGLLRIRPTADNLAGGGTAATVARAEHNLASGDLAGAVKSLETLAEGPAAAAASWLARARSRMAAEAALAGLHSYAVALLAGKGEG